MPLHSTESPTAALQRLQKLGLVEDASDERFNIQQALCKVLNSIGSPESLNSPDANSFQVKIKLEDNVTFLVKGLLALIAIATK